MKRKIPEWVWWVLGGTVTLAVVVLLILSFAVVPDKYLVVGASEEQVRQLLRGAPENRVWFEDADQLMGNKYMLEIVYRARYWEGDRIAEFLKEVGVEYELLDEGR